MEKLNLFIKTVNDNNFIEGHEVLEDTWKEWKKIETLKEESLILKGLINGSTALALKVKNRDDGAKRVWKTFLKYSPLIEQIDSKYKSEYKKAEKLLYEKAVSLKLTHIVK